MTRAAILAGVLAACGGGGGAGSAAKRPAEPTHVTRTIPIADTEPEDGVEVVSTRGHMDPAVVEVGLAPHKASLSDCYTTRVGRRRWLGGHVALHWDINKDGEVTAVKLAESDLGAWPVEKCLLEVARMATFGKPIGGDADFMVPLDFTSKGKPAFWDEDEGIKAVGGQLVKLDACAKTKGVKGGHPSDVTITVYVGPQGKAQSVGFASAKTVLDDLWVDCAEKAALAWRLPDPKGTVA
ncbi:MAG: AgmX/PglI C-terminal domain-containing protein, partial [Kofleriaceae bacterium]